MPYIEIIWDLDNDEGGNVQHILEHGLTKDDVSNVLSDPIDEGFSRSSGCPIAFGYTASGKHVAVVYERIDDFKVYPITAFEVD